MTHSCTKFTSSGVDLYTLSSDTTPELTDFFRISAAGVITLAESLVDAPPRIELDVAIASSAACRSRSVSVTVAISPCTVVAGEVAAAAACGDGGGTCGVDGGSGVLSCQCGAGLFGPRCLPRSPSMATPPPMTIAVRQPPLATAPSNRP